MQTRFCLLQIWSVSDKDVIFSTTNMYAIGYIIVGLVAAVSMFLQVLYNKFIYYVSYNGTHLY